MEKAKSVNLKRGDKIYLYIFNPKTGVEQFTATVEVPYVNKQNHCLVSYGRPDADKKIVERSIKVSPNERDIYVNTMWMSEYDPEVAFHIMYLHVLEKHEKALKDVKKFAEQMKMIRKQIELEEKCH